MSYFSRLTDIVTCNLTQLLAQAEDPHAAILEIIQEMQEGLAGAQRSVNTARNSEDHLRQEIDSHRSQIDVWMAKVKEQLQTGAEADARQSLLRKREVEDLIAGLAQQHDAAVKYREHLSTMKGALEARLSEALRRRESLGVPATEAPSNVPDYLLNRQTITKHTDHDVEAELQRLKKELSS
ncbi:MAG: PspA/IM30 family protein [Schlesneria sp.]